MVPSAVPGLVRCCSAVTVGVLAKYPNLRRCLREHLKEADPTQPSEDKVVRIIQASEHAPEAEIIKALRNLNERGYGANHIRTYAYFETALADYFSQRQELEDAAHPCGYDEWADRNGSRLSEAKFDSLSDSF